MTKLLLSLLLTTTALGAERLTNADVIGLTTAKLSPDVIIAAITHAETSFDTSTTALIALRKAGVANAVISAMLGAAPASETTVLRFEFPRVSHRTSAMRGYIGTLHLYDDRLAFVPLRASWGAYALTLPWTTITSLCFEEGPLTGALFITAEDRERAVRLDTDRDAIQPLRKSITGLTTRAVPECE